MITVKEHMEARDEWIYTLSSTLCLKVVASHAGLSVSRVKAILARIRKAKNA